MPSAQLPQLAILTLLEHLIAREGLLAEEAAGRLGLHSERIDTAAGTVMVIGQISGAQIAWAHGYIAGILREGQKAAPLAMAENPG